jgi:ribosome-binding protein aMBF1 (putative translation factor)
LKDCPDLTKLSPPEKAEFWQKTDPRDLRMVGDRLLAESLPHVESSVPREEVSRKAAQSREKLGWSLEQVSETLGITTQVLEAWEEDRVKPPECLPLVLDKLGEPHE